MNEQKLANEWTKKWFLGYYKVPVTAISHPAADIATRPLDPAHVARLIGVIKACETVNSDMYIVVRSKEGAATYLNSKRSFDLSKLLTDTKVPKEVFGGAHSVESMKQVLAEAGGKERYGELLEKPTFKVFLSDETPQTLKVLRLLGSRDNRLRAMHKSMTFRDMLFLMRQFRDESRDAKAVYCQKDAVARFRAATGLAEGTAQQYFQFVADELEWTWIDAILAESERAYGTGNPVISSAPRKKIVADPTSDNPPPKLRGNKSFIKMLGLSHDDRVDMLMKLYNRQITVKQFEEECALLSNQTFVYGNIVLEARAWLKQHRPGDVVPPAWEDFCLKYPRLADEGWLETLVGMNAGRKNATLKHKFLATLKAQTIARLEAQFVPQKVNFILNYSAT